MARNTHTLPQTLNPSKTYDVMHGLVAGRLGFDTATGHWEFRSADGTITRPMEPAFCAGLEIYGEVATQPDPVGRPCLVRHPEDASRVLPATAYPCDDPESYYVVNEAGTARVIPRALVELLESAPDGQAADPQAQPAAPSPAVAPELATALHAVAAKAAQAQGVCPARLARALALALSGGVVRGTSEHSAQVRGTSATVYTVAEGKCSCQDYQHGHPLCKHRLALALVVRAQQALAPRPEPEAPHLPITHPVIAEQYIVTISGKPFVRYAGLLQLAHARGLVSLVAEWTYNDATLSFAKATAVLTDGRTATECGDASPDNVGKKVASHWRRVALTRSKARCLRDLLGVDLVAVEELGE